MNIDEYRKQLYESTSDKFTSEVKVILDIEKAENNEFYFDLKNCAYLDGHCIIYVDGMPTAYQDGLENIYFLISPESLLKEAHFDKDESRVYFSFSKEPTKLPKMYIEYRYDRDMEGLALEYTTKYEMSLEEALKYTRMLYEESPERYEELLKIEL